MHYGADYNPEQWPEELWPEDVARMREAGVTMVSLGIFAWARIQPREGEFDFGWLDRVIDLLHEGGIAVDLATATASPPPWASAAYPELLPQDEDGATYWPGSRQQFAPSSPVYRRLAAELVTAIAERYATASGRRDVARQQRVRLPPEHGLLGCRARRVPRAGWPIGTATSTPSTPPGARTSGRSATSRSTRCSRRARRPTA